MPNASKFALTPKALLVALISACYPLSALAAAGKVEFVIGNVAVIGPDGRSRPLTKGADIDAGDTIQTGNGRAQVRFIDGGFISLTPDTEFKVNEYNYSGKADGTEKGFFGLVKGGLRAVTGAIGHTNKKTYIVNTPVATIGIRGTEFLATMDQKLVVRVGDGAIYLVNGAGDIVLYKGQSGEVEDANSRPRYTPYGPLVNAAGPAWGTPEIFRQEIRLEQPDQYRYSYVAGVATNAEGIACELIGGCVTSSTSSMAYLVANNLVGQYSLTQATSPATGNFTANFGTGTITSFDFGAGGNFVTNLSGTVSGNSFSVSGPATLGTFDATGAFFGTNAAQAGMTYNFSAGGSGSAVFEQTSLSP